MILREAEERMKLIGDNTVARVFSAKYWERYLYPYALQHVREVDQGVRDTCYEYILDSGKNDEDVTNRDVIEKAIDINADYVMPKDYVGDQRRTRRSMREFFRLYAEEYPECRATPFVILQPPYIVEYVENRDFYDEFGHFALGGLQLFDPEQQVEELLKFRKMVGPNAYVHALGIGTGLTIINTLRENPRVIDSLDMSTAEMLIKHNQLPDKHWRRTDFHIPKGIDSTTVRSRFAAAILYMMNYMLGTRIDDDVVDTEYYENTVLDEVADMQADHRNSLRDAYGAPDSSPDPAELVDDVDDSDVDTASSD